MAEDTTSTLNLRWVFGLNPGVGAFNLSSEEREAYFYTAAHVGIIYEPSMEKQKHLLGHTSEIKACCVSNDKRWIFTADRGTDAMVVAWDSLSANPVRTIFTPHAHGVEHMDISGDSAFLVTLSRTSEPGTQELSVWDWYGNSEKPLLSTIIDSAEVQTHVRVSSTNPQQIITNGAKTVRFWNWDASGIQSTTVEPFSSRVGQYTQSMFLPDSVQAVTATTEGDLILWDIMGATGDSLEGGVRKAVKIVRLHETKINSIIHTKDYIVTAGADGFVRFYDFQFRLVAWFEGLNAGPVTTVSFANKTIARYEEGATFFATDFIVSTKQSMILTVNPKIFESVDPRRADGKVLLALQNGSVHGIATHPFKHRLAICSHSGLVQVWDYNVRKKMQVSRKFDKLFGQCISYDPLGNYLALGFTNGVLKVLNAKNLKDITKGTFRQSRDCVTEVVFSSDGRWLATSDADRCVAVYYCASKGQQEYPLPSSRDRVVIDLADESETTSGEEWQFIGKYRSHLKPIVGLTFAKDATDEPRLLSLGQDQVVIEYDLKNSSVTNGLLIKQKVNVEQVAVPTSFALHPRTSAEEFIIMATDHFKFKILNGLTLRGRQTVMGPAFGGALKKIAVVTDESKNKAKPSHFLVYATAERVIGLVKLPLDGNPYKSMGLIAHPGEVSTMAISHDGKFVFTAGGRDMCVNMWALNFAPLEAAAEAHTGIEPFIELLEGGRGGAFWKEMKEYFYYAQIKNQGEGSTDSHSLGHTIPLEQFVDVLRALGYFPTQKEAEELVNEIKFAQYVETGKYTESIDFETLITLYVNHRPTFGIGKEEIDAAFRTLGGKKGGIDTGQLFELLKTKGEKFSSEELERCVSLVCGSGTQALQERLKRMTAKDFSETVLGFSDPAAPDAATTAEGTQTFFEGEDLESDSVDVDEGLIEQQEAFESRTAIVGSRARVTRGSVSKSSRPGTQVGGKSLGSANGASRSSQTRSATPLHR